MKRLVLMFCVGVIPACSSPSLQGAFSGTDVAAEGASRPEARPETLDTPPPPPPPPTARTVDDFDTTSAEERAAAVAPKPEDEGTERQLGTTIATLGSPTDPGIWLKTPLVTSVTQGRVEYPVNGKSVNVELRPSGGEPGSGSQISLAAMRLLEAPLTGLPELVVYAN